MLSRKIITRDGSPTIYSERYRQHYHNMSGALAESRHVFFNRTGIIDALGVHRDFTICEIGFGTGFHVFLLDWLHQELKSKSRIQYYSVEKYPVSGDVVRQMDFTDLFSGSGALADHLIHFSDTLVCAETGSTIQLDLSSIAVRVYHGDFYDWDLAELISKQTDPGPVHFFLFDAFSPQVNPELWTPEVFSKLLSIADDEAVLATYCSATRARAAMILAGWHVARAGGPWGKREMTLASPSEHPLVGYKRVNEERLRDRFRDSW